MTSLSYKAKQSTWFALKGIILIGAFYFLANTFQRKLSESYILFETVEWMKVIPWLFLFLLASIVNWCLEIAKWKLLVSKLQKIHFLTAMRQSLSAHFVSILTPNKIGEFGVKATFFPKYKRKRVLLLTFVGNVSQLTATLLFGIIGMLFMNSELRNLIQDLFSNTGLFIFCIAILTMVLFVILFYKKEWFIKGLSVQKIFQYIIALPLSLKVGSLMYSISRYLVFSFLFYGIYILLGGNTPLWETLTVIYVMYFLSSLVPVFHVFDVVIKGSVAVWLFQFLGVNEWIVLGTTFLMWLLNVAIPAIIGGFILLKINRP